MKASERKTKGKGGRSYKEKIRTEIRQVNGPASLKISAFFRWLTTNNFTGRNRIHLIFLVHPKLRAKSRFLKYSEKQFKGEQILRYSMSFDTSNSGFVDTNAH